MRRTKFSIKTKVLKNNPIQKQGDKEDQKEKSVAEKRKKSFSNIYNKIKYWSPSENPNCNTFCSLHKDIFRSEILSPNAKIIYTVLCAETDFKRNKWTQISQENLRLKSGLSIPTINNSLEELTNYDYYINDTYKVKLLARKKHTEGKRTFWLYMPWFIKEDQIKEFKGEQFFFYTYIIETGLWSHLRRRSKALYLVMKATSKFDFMLYCDVEEYDYSTGNSEEIYRDRKWEVCKTPLTQLCDEAQISYSNINKATNELIKYGFIDRIEDGFIVYQCPEPA